MDRMTDERLDSLLAAYYESEPSRTLTYRGAERRKTALPPFRIKHFAAAASLILVTVLSVGLYFFFRNKSDVIPPVSSPQSATPSAQGRGDVPGASVPETRSGAVPTESADVRRLENSVITPEAPSVSASAVPTTHVPLTHVSPTEKHAETEIETAYVPPTHVSPTEQPTNVPTEPRHVPPTDPPWNPEPVEPTDSGNDPPEPVEYPTQPEPKNYCYAYFPYDGGELFCYIEDENGNMMGDPDLFSAQHIAEITYTYYNGYALARWSPNEHGIRPSGGYHRYVFYNGNGKTVFADYVHAQGVN